MEFIVARPGYVKCIQDNRDRNIGKSLCGRNLGVVKTELDENQIPVQTVDFTEWCFLDIDHWFFSAQNGDYLMGCPFCLQDIFVTCYNTKGPVGQTTEIPLVWEQDE